MNISDPANFMVNSFLNIGNKLSVFGNQAFKLSNCCIIILSLYQQNTKHFNSTTKYDFFLCMETFVEQLCGFDTSADKYVSPTGIMYT